MWPGGGEQAPMWAGVSRARRHCVNTRRGAAWPGRTVRRVARRMPASGQPLHRALGPLIYSDAGVDALPRLGESPNG